MLARPPATCQNQASVRRVVPTIAIAAGALALASPVDGGETASRADSRALAPGAAEGAGASAFVTDRKRPTAQTSGHAKLTLIKTRFGRMLADRNGNALYLFTRDKPDRSRCRGDCAVAWPPLKTRRTPKAGKGVRRKLLGITRRRNGSKQVTYKGHPLYYYVNERGPGAVGCQNVFQFGGRWLVVSRKGKAIS